MPHHQIPQNVRYAMPGHPSISPGPQAQLMYHPHPAQAPSPYGTAAQWQLAAPSPAPHPSGGGSDRATPNPMMPPEYLHHAQLPPGMILQQAAHMLQPTNNQSQPGGVAGGGNAYTSSNATAVGPSPHPQQQ